MLEVCKKQIQTPLKETQEIKDIIVTRYETKTEYQEDGTKITKRIPIKINITKKVNETAKLLKQERAEDIIAQVEKLVSQK